MVFPAFKTFKNISIKFQFIWCTNNVTESKLSDQTCKSWQCQFTKKLPDASDTASERNHFWGVIIICPGDNYTEEVGTSRWWTSWTSKAREAFKNWEKMIQNNSPNIWNAKQFWSSGTTTTSSSSPFNPLHCNMWHLRDPEKTETNFTLLTNGRGLIGRGPYLAEMTLEANLGWNWPHCNQGRHLQSRQ